MVESVLAKHVVVGSNPIARFFKEVVMCGCGRSPREDGKCVGFHKLSEQEWNERKEILVEEYKKSQDSSVGRAAD